MYEIAGEPMEIVDLYVVPRVPREIRNPVDVNRVVDLILCLICVLCLIPSVLSDVSDGSFIITVPLVSSFQKFESTVTIQPSGTAVVSATHASGTLTVYNGSILVQQLPPGFIVSSQGGVEIATDRSVIVPAGNPPAYGMVKVQAHAVVAGVSGNIGALSINAVYGESLYIKNLTPFTGGVDVRAETYATETDKAAALSTARYKLNTQAKQYPAMLDRQCGETIQQNDPMLTVVWSCQFASYHVPAGLHVLSVQKIGESVKLEVSR